MLVSDISKIKLEEFTEYTELYTLHFTKKKWKYTYYQKGVNWKYIHYISVITRWHSKPMLLPETKWQEQVSCLERPPTLKKYMTRKNDNNFFNCMDLQFFFVQLSVWQLDVITFHLFRTEEKNLCYLCLVISGTKGSCISWI